MTLPEYHAWLRNEGCIITRYYGPQLDLHHCHGGSMSRAGIHRGRGQKVSDWLVIPLIHALHMTFHDNGVLTWEAKHGEQAGWIEERAREAGVWGQVEPLFMGETA